MRKIVVLIVIVFVLFMVGNEQSKKENTYAVYKSA